MYCFSVNETDQNITVKCPRPAATQAFSLIWSVSVLSLLMCLIQCSAEKLTATKTYLLKRFNNSTTRFRIGRRDIANSTRGAQNKQKSRRSFQNRLNCPLVRNRHCQKWFCYIDTRSLRTCIVSCCRSGRCKTMLDCNKGFSRTGWNSSEPQ